MDSDSKTSRPNQQVLEGPEHWGKDELREKINALKKQIAKLKSQQASLLYDELAGTSKAAIREPRNLQKQEEEDRPEMSIEYLTECVELNSIFTGLRFGNLYKLYSDKHTYSLSGDGIGGGCVPFHIDITIKEKEPEAMEICSLNLILKDDFHQKELTSWKNRCVREKALWKFGFGLQSYAPLFIRRSKILEWLSTDYKRYFDISEDNDVSGYVITAFSKSAKIKLFKALWKIEWSDLHDGDVDDETFRMSYSLSFTLIKKDKELRNACKTLCSTVDPSDEDIKKFWMEGFDFICRFKEID